MYGTWVEWLAQEITNMIKTRKDMLPPKAKRDSDPQVYWMSAPYHGNFDETETKMRAKFNLILEDNI